MDKTLRLEIFYKAALCRNFERTCFKYIKEGLFKFPFYLSAGEEFIPATLSTLFGHRHPLIFAQHRAHSTYLCYGGDIRELIDELLGRKTGCANGMGGSASIQSKKIKMFGHDGLMGSQIPIAVGACLASNQFTLGIMGDAAVEEDYVMSAISWAGSKQLPIAFIVEDNNLSVLTEKSVRRTWHASDFAKSVNVDGYELEDSPELMWEILSHVKDARHPMLFNISTDRLFWHSGAGIDEYEKRDRYELEIKELGSEAVAMDSFMKQHVEAIWEEQLKKQ